MDFLNCTNQFDLTVIQALAQKTLAIQDEREEHLATRIANAVGKMLGA
jgi:hypothetical protein